MKLADIQTLLQEQIVTERSEPSLIHDEIVDGPRLNSERGIEIYRNMYQARVYSALADDYPAVHHLLGDDEFTRLAQQYIQVFPSRSFTLELLGNKFPEFLKSSDLANQEMLYLSDLAALEYAVNYAFHAAQGEPLRTHDIDFSCLDDYLDRRLSLSPSVSLLESQYNVNCVYSRHEAKIDWNPDDFLKEKTYLMVLREGDDIWRYRLNSFSFLFLTALHEGKTLGESIDQVLCENPGQDDMEDLFEGFALWLQDGAFSRS